MARLQPFKDRARTEFDRDPYLKDIVERNLEIAAQCCIDISHRIISLENARKPADYREAILRLGELDVLPADFARHLAPVASFRNVLVHEYTSLDWDQVYQMLQQMKELEKFAKFIRDWLHQRNAPVP